MVNINRGPITPRTLIDGTLDWDTAWADGVHDHTSDAEGGVLDLGVDDHGELSGLEDDDHTQYILADGTRQFSDEAKFANTGAATATADQSSIYCADCAAGDARLYIQSETGSPILIGGNSIRVIAGTISELWSGDSAVLAALYGAARVTASSTKGHIGVIGVSGAYDVNAASSSLCALRGYLGVKGINTDTTVGSLEAAYIQARLNAATGKTVTASCLDGLYVSIGSDSGGGTLDLSGGIIAGLSVRWSHADDFTNVGNVYGLWIEDTSSFIHATNALNIFSEGTASRNSFKGNLELGNAASVVAALADTVRLYGDDYASGDARLYVQSEAGSPIIIGNDAIVVNSKTVVLTGDADWDTLWTDAVHSHASDAEGGTVDASVISYTPTVATDWDGDADPGDLDDALDQLAERVDDLEAAPPSHVHDAADVTYTPNVLTDWDSDADPGDTNDALDQLAERVDDVENAGYLTSVDAADVTYTPNVLTDWDSDADPGDTNDALDQLAERTDDLEATSHATITLAADADVLLSLSTQEIGLDNQNANTVFAGPTDGAAADPTFRALVAADVPDISATYAVAAKGVTNGDTHDHAGGDGAQIDHGGLAGLSDADHVAASVGFTATDKLLGRSTAGAGDGEEIACTSAGRDILDDATAAAQRVTLAAQGYVDRGDPAVYDFSVGDLTTDTTWRDLDLSSIVPAGATAVYIRIYLLDDAANSQFGFRTKGNSNAYAITLCRTQVANVVNDIIVIVKLNAGRVIQYIGSNTTFDHIDLIVLGWWI